MQFLNIYIYIYIYIYKDVLSTNIAELNVERPLTIRYLQSSREQSLRKAVGLPDPGSAGAKECAGS